MDLELAGKSVLITGGASGIGLAAGKSPIEAIRAMDAKAILALFELLKVPGVFDLAPGRHRVRMCQLATADSGGAAGRAACLIRNCCAG